MHIAHTHIWVFWDDGNVQRDDVTNNVSPEVLTFEPTKSEQFLHNFSKSVKPIFHNAGPISQHTALEGTINKYRLLMRGMVENYCA